MHYSWTVVTKDHLTEKVIYPPSISIELETQSDWLIELRLYILLDTE